MIRFLHSADLQLGMPFHKIPGDRGARLREARLSAIDRLGEAARHHAASFIVIAGDCFDANTVDDWVVHQSCERFRSIDVPIYVLPGNHDASGGPDSVYRRPSFLASRPANLVVVDTRTPVVIDDGRAVLLPAPLVRRHEVGDTTLHITPEFGRAAAPSAVRIGLAHGAVVNFGEPGEGDATNLIDPRRATLAELDYLALGDWHGMKRIDARTWYSGAPEPTSFRSRDPGYALAVAIEKPGAEPVVTPVFVAATRWIQHEERVFDAHDVTRLEGWFETLEQATGSVVDLALEGSLSFELLARLERLLSRAEGRVLHLRRSRVRVVPEASDEELAALRGEGYLRVAVERLRAEAGAGGPDAGRAARALQLLHRMQSEAGSC